MSIHGYVCPSLRLAVALRSSVIRRILGALVRGGSAGGPACAVNEPCIDCTWSWTGPASYEVSCTVCLHCCVDPIGWCCEGGEGASASPLVLLVS